LPTERDNRSIAIALSGGGYRASLFHLGALRRLNELGLLDRVARISSVSGGSILAGRIADRMIELGKVRPQFDDWEKDIARDFRRFVGKDIRTKLLLRYFVWNAFSPKQRADALAKVFETRLTSKKLGQLPKSGDGTEFLFLATDVERGIMWQFGPRTMTSHKFRKKIDCSDISIARAVAASACFPPMFGPIKLEGHTKSGEEFIAWLSDGGVYDNLGLEPVWKGKRFNPVFVSDGGAVLDIEIPKRYAARQFRYASIAMDQVRALRQRTFVARIKREEKKANGFRGALWRNASLKSNFIREATAGGKQRIQEMTDAGWYGYDDSEEGTITNWIAKIRTDLDRFTTAEAKILENHGYFNADIAIRTFHAHLMLAEESFRVPHGEDEYLDDAPVREHLKHSHSRWSFWRRNRQP
jgi:NTE family protein